MINGTDRRMDDEVTNMKQQTDALARNEAMTVSHGGTRHTIPIHHVDEILRGVQRRGLEVEAVLRRAGISPTLLDSDRARVSQDQYARLIRQVQRATRDEFAGLCHTPLKFGSFALICENLIACHTLGEAMRRGFSIYRLLSDDFHPHLSVSDGIACVRLRETHDADDRLIYPERMFMFFSMGVASWLVARRIPVRRVEYRGPAPGRGSNSARLFQSSVHFGQPAFRLFFDAHWLELPVVQNAMSLRVFLGEAPANLLVRYRDQTSLSERIRRLLRRNLGGELPTLEAVCGILAMTPQTLRRRLRAEGHSFQTLKDDLRRDAAIEHLARKELSLIEVAAQLGYSEASTFHRAFKKWTGLPPGEYRETRLNEEIKPAESVPGRGRRQAPAPD